jgi:uncharacterized repeat protein (TIGR01451 family)
MFSDPAPDYNSPYYTAPVYTAPASTAQSSLPQLGKTSGPKVLPNPILGESYDNHPTQRLQWDNTNLVVKPGRVVAPVGSQVVVIAGVVAPDKYLSMNERIDWSLTSGSVGQFVEVDPGSYTDMFLADFTFPRKVSTNQAVTSTSRYNMNLNRGTPTKDDDIKIRRGETWVVVNSPVEGTSFVTVRAPSVYDWNVREKTAMIHWIDAEWQFPAPSFAPAGGQQTLTTKLTRHSDHKPLVGWRVRYTITGGPKAGFNGANVTEAITNQNGEATVVISEEQAVAGTSQIKIEVVRPDGVNGIGFGTGNVQSSAVTVEHNSTTVTWSAPELSLIKRGPPSVGIGSIVTYQINVSNPGDLPTDDVQIVDEIPLGTEYIGSTPTPSQTLGTTVRWEIGRLAPGETRSVQVQLRAQQAGTMKSCAEATAVGGLSARGCVTTQVGSPKLEIKIVNRNSNVRVGDVVSFDIYIKNLSQVAATNLTVFDRFDKGLVSDVPEAMDYMKIETHIADIQPGATRPIRLNFKTEQQGRLCHEVTVTDSTGNTTTASGCIDVAPAASTDVGPATPGTPPGTIPGTPGTTPGGSIWDHTSTGDTNVTAKPYVSVEKTGPAQLKIGEKGVFDIVVKNLGQVELTNLVFVDQYDRQLVPTQSSIPRETREIKNGWIRWTLTSLSPGQSKRYRIEYEMNAPAGQVRNQVRVTTDQGVEDTSETPITIVAPAPVGPGLGDPGTGTPGMPGTSTQQGNLALTVYDNSDGVAAGTPINYTIKVTNQSQTVTDENVILTIDLSTHLIPIKSGTLCMGSTSAPNITGQRIMFAPVPSLLPGDSVSYLVNVKSNAPGMAKVTVSVKSKNVQAFQKVETTKITSR